MMNQLEFIRNLSDNRIVDEPNHNQAIANTQILLQKGDAIWDAAVLTTLAAKVIPESGQYYIDPDVISSARIAEHYDGKIFNRPVADLVQQGGGMYGIALAGYSYILEKAGIRFNNLGGTSSGGISAMLLGAMPDSIYNDSSVFNAKSQAHKSELLAHIIANTNFSKFMERRGIIGMLQRKLLRQFNTRSLRIFVIIAVAILPIILYFAFGLVFRTSYGIWSDELRVYDFVTGTLAAAFPAILFYILLVRILGRDFGINSGQAFYNWISGILSDANIGASTTADLYQNLAKSNFTNKGTVSDSRRKLVLISANLTHNRIVKFPESAADYWGEAFQDVNPAAYVRATMSIPFIFDTFIPGAEHFTNSKSVVKLKARFVDGGLLSNFPIREFHVEAKPRFPTFGVLLKDAPEAKTINRDRPEPFAPFSLIKFLISFFSTFRNFYDNDFLLRNPEIRMRVETVYTQDFSWLDFWMDDTTKQKLFEQGARAAIRQLEKFDWQEYIKLR